MHNVQRSALVPYSAEQMFRLVDDIEAYPEFLPWCSDARIESRRGNTVEASLEMKKGTLRKRFTTRNSNHFPDSIKLELVGGLFRNLEGGWQFTDLSEHGSKVTLELAFQFESGFLDMLLGSFFEDTCNRLVDAFTERAAVVYRSTGQK